MSIVDEIKRDSCSYCGASKSKTTDGMSDLELIARSISALASTIDMIAHETLTLLGHDLHAQMYDTGNQESIDLDNEFKRRAALRKPVDSSK